RWLDASGEARAAHERLRTWALEWDRLGRPSESLWSVAQVREMDPVPSESLEARESAFLRASRRAHKARRALRWAIVLSLVAFAAATYVGVRWYRRRAQREAVATLVRQTRELLARARAQLDRFDAERSGAFAAFDREDFAGGEPIWKQAEQLARQAD